MFTGVYMAGRLLVTITVQLLAPWCRSKYLGSLDVLAQSVTFGNNPKHTQEIARDFLFPQSNNG